MADLRNLIESALSQHLESETSATVYKGTGNLTKAAPCVIVQAGNSSEDIPQSGVHRVNVSVMVKSIAKGDTGAHDTLCGSVRDALSADDDTLNTALRVYESTLWIFGNGGADGLESDTDEDAWVQTFNLELVACATS